MLFSIAKIAITTAPQGNVFFSKGSVFDIETADQSVSLSKTEPIFNRRQITDKKHSGGVKPPLRLLSGRTRF